MTMFKYISICALILFLSGCSGDDNSTGSNNDDDGGNNFPAIGFEMEPAIGNSHTTVYFIVDDTTAENNDGIYYALTSNPIRKLLLAGEGYHSPTMSPDFTRLAYLKNNHINYYYPQLDSLEESGVSETFTKLVAISNYYLLGYYMGAIYLIDYKTGNVTYLTDGYDISFYTGDTAVYLNDLGSGMYSINKLALDVLVDGDIVEYSSSYSPVDTIISNSKISSLSLEPQSQRFAYHKYSASGYEIYTSKIGGINSNLIITTTHGNPLMLDIDFLIYIGDDWLFYRTDYLGTEHYLFRGAAY